MKLFKTENIDVVKDCQGYFDIDPLCMVFMKRQDRFTSLYLFCQSLWCSFFLRDLVTFIVVSLFCLFISFCTVSLPTRGIKLYATS